MTFPVRAPAGVRCFRLRLPPRYPIAQKLWQAEATKKPLVERPFAKRLMGLEPTTFCMASRRSSQLSYSRARREYSPEVARLRGGFALPRASLCT
jgi:hypothetical protein